jgi:hypothetical protein
MVAEAASRQDRAMARLVILWMRPYHLSDEDADTWVRRESARLLALDGIERGELARLQSGSSRQTGVWDWMLELHLREGVDGQACAEHPALAEWLLDLRLLGMRPTIMLVERPTALAPEEG